MAFTGLKVTGLSALQSALQKMRDEANDMRDAILDESAELVIGEAKQEDRCPYDWGTLSDSHTWVVGPKEGTRLLGANTDYAAAVHANHASKARWLLIATVDLGPGIIEKVTKKHLEQRGFQ